MADILAEVLKLIPDKKKISESLFEGANIVLYTKDKDFFLNNNGTIIKIVDALKKRIELRPDPAISMPIEEAEEMIRKIVPKDAGVANIIFDPQRSRVIIEAEKPGLAIGKQGELLKEIKTKTFWVPLIKRTPAIRSKLIENIRYVLYENSDFRRKFLNKVGKRIYGGWTKEKRNEWIRVTFLGGAREVGRSCLLLQTPESKILMDCGVNVAATVEQKAYPMFDVPEFNLQEIDAVILTHAHLDHCLHPSSYIQLGDGTISKIEDFYKNYRNDIKCLDIDDSLSIEDWNCFEKVMIPAPKKMYKIKTKSKEIIVTGEHPFFLLKDLKIIDKKSKELKKGEFIATVRRIPFKGQTQKLNDIIRIVSINKKGKEILKKERLRRKLKQNDVAKKIGCTQVTISFIEQNENSCCNLNLFKKLVNSYGLNEKFIHKYTNKRENKSVKIRLPKTTSKELLQFLGYLLGDGCKVDRIFKGKKVPIGKRQTRIELTDKNIENLKNYKEIGDKLFGLKGRIKIKERNRLVYTSPILLDFINEIGASLLCRSPYRKIPDMIHKVPNNELTGFLKGFYDAEGSVGDHHIVLTSTSYDIIQVTKMLLQRYGIVSHTYKTKGNFRSSRNVYQLVIFNPKSINLFRKNIGFSELIKKEKLDSLIKKIGNACAERMDLIPFSCDIILRIAKKLGLRKIDLRNLGINYYHYLNHNPARKKLNQIYKVFKNKAEELKINLEEIEELGRLVKSDILWDPIQDIKEVESDCDFVYDLKVAGHHNYIANGIIVHNCGLIPALYKMGYEGPLYCTAPTRDVASLLALDYIGIAQKEALKPLYTSTDIKNMVKHTICLNYEEVTDITPDVRLTLYNAGHTLGSAMAHLHIGNGLHNLLYTGDMNYETSNLLAAAATRFPRLETVMIEATYGSKDDILASRKECEKYLLDVITTTIKNKGRVLMPTLGVGRSQEIMLILEKAIREGLIDKVPIYVQGMVWDVTAIHTTYPDFFNNRVRRNIFHKDHNPFLSNVFKHVAGYKEMQEVIEEKGPCVIIATSGMMVGGPSVEYFKALADNPKNALILTCYQGEGSLGRRLQQGEKVIGFQKGEKTEETQVKMSVHTISGFSGHSSRKQLMQFVYNLSPKPKRIIVNHGESSKCLDLASSLHKIHRIETNAPKNLEAIRIR